MFSTEYFKTEPLKMVDTQKVRLKKFKNVSQSLIKMFHSGYSKVFHSRYSKMFTAFN